MLNNAVLSLIRTYVPIGIGLLLTLLARNTASWWTRTPAPG